MQDYSIWLVEYGYCPTQPVSSFFYGWHNQGILPPVPFTYLVVKGNGRLIAVDTGYYDEGYGHELCVKFDIVGMCPIEETLAGIGLDGTDFDTVLLTHAHYDHMGGLKAFPNAHFYIQKKELFDWLDVMARPKAYSGLPVAIDPNDMKNAVDLVARGQMTLVDGPVENILPGISLIPVPDSHTYGHQLVSIKRGRGLPGGWIFTGDVCYSFRNFGEKGGDGPYIPVGFGVGSITEMITALVKINELAEGNLDRLIIPHDGDMWTLFPSKKLANGLHIAEIQLADGEPSRL